MSANSSITVNPPSDPSLVTFNLDTQPVGDVPPPTGELKPNPLLAPNVVLEQNPIPDVGIPPLIPDNPPLVPNGGNPPQGNPNQAVPPPNAHHFTFGTRTAYMPVRELAPMAENTDHFIRASVANGAVVYHAIVDGHQPLPAPSEENLRNLMWFLQALGSAKAGDAVPPPHTAGMFKEGAFSIEDPQQRLYNWLRDTNSYTRPSTHLGNFQDGPGGSPRGVDVKSLLTPNGRGTILFGRMPVDDLRGSKPAKGMGRQMLYLKMEPYGCRKPFSPFGGHHSAPRGFFGHLHAAWRGFKNIFINTKTLVQHTAETVRTRGRQNYAGEMNNRERVDTAIARQFTALCIRVDGVSENLLPANVRQTLSGMLDANQPVAAHGGIRVMRENLRLAREYIVQHQDEISPQIQVELLGAIDALLPEINSQGDHPELRIGHEIILLQDDPLLQQNVVLH